jgi:hypothetical protein
MKNLLLILPLLIVGCASVPKEPFVYAENLESLRGFHYYEDALKDDWFLHDKLFLNLDKADKFKECMGLDVFTDIHVQIVTASWVPTGCTGIAFSEFGIFINNAVDGKGQNKNMPRRNYISYEELLSNNTTFNIINDYELKILINNGSHKILLASGVYGNFASRMKKIFLQGRDEYRYNPRKYSQVVYKGNKTIPKKFFDLIDESNSDLLTVFPNIPQGKEDNFRKCNKIDESEKFIAYIDLTLFARNGCEGIAFTNTGFYIKPSKWSEGRGLGEGGRFFFSYYDYMMYEFTPTSTNLGERSIAPSIFINTEYTKIFDVMRDGVSLTDEQVLNEFKPIYSNQTNMEVAKQIVRLALPLFLVKESWSSCDLPNRPSKPIASSPRSVKSSYNSRSKRYNKALSTCKKNKRAASLLLWFWEDVDRAIFDS